MRRVLLRTRCLYFQLLTATTGPRPHLRHEAEWQVLVVAVQMGDPHWEVSSVPAWLLVAGSPWPQELRLGVHLQWSGLA